MKYNLLIVENHPLTRQTLVYQTKKFGIFKSTDSVENGALALEFVQENPVDLILMDIDMPVMNGIEATSEIKKIKDIPTIILTNFSERDKVLGAFKSGANAYCVKNIKQNELKYVMELILEGGIWFDKKIAQYIYDILQHLEKEQIENKISIRDFDISEREKEVLKLVSEGMSNEEICEKLFISKFTVKNHISSLINKLSVKDRTQAAVLALKNKFFE